MSYYRNKMRTLLTRRTGDWLRRHNWPRFGAAIVLLMATMTAVVCWQSLVNAGLTSEGLRVALSFLAGYIAYLVCMALWLTRFVAMDSKCLLVGGVGGAITTQIPGESEFDDSLDTQMEIAFRQAGNDARNILGLVAAAAVLGAMFVAIHFVYHAPYYLGQLLVDGGKIRHRAMPSGTMLDGVTLPFLQSWPIAIALLFNCTVIGLVLDATLR
jgi:hypothetical protein